MVTGPRSRAQLGEVTKKLEFPIVEAANFVSRVTRAVSPYVEMARATLAGMGRRLVYSLG